MADHSAIEWTDATWNPIVGCSIVSPGCTNCYAMDMAARLQKMNPTGNSGTSYVNHYDGTTKKVNGHVVWTGKVARAPNHLIARPLEWKKPRRIFVNSMGDLFHESVPDEWILDVLTIIAIGAQHTFQVLTKRADRMREFMGRPDLLDDIYANWYSFSGGAREVYSWPLHNLWLGVSAEDQPRWNHRHRDLAETPAKVRFVSYEPALGPIAMGDSKWLGSWLNWLICGGESGPGARPMSIQWAREVRDQCATAGVPYFFKQWGNWRPAGIHPAETPGRFAFGDYEHDRACMIQTDHYPRQFTKFGARSAMQHVGKKAAGRLLDGVEHNAMPEASR